MGRRCCVAGCPSTTRFPEHHGVTYHSFPLEPTIRALWLRNTRIPAEKQITKSVLVCSRHFRRMDFQPQRSGKFLLKHKVFPTVLPWGKIDPEEIEADLQMLNEVMPRNAKANISNSRIETEVATSSKSNEQATTATVEATVAQIMAETAELSAAGGIKAATPIDKFNVCNTPPSEASVVVKYEPVASFNSGIRLEAQDFDGVWHPARVMEVDHHDSEVLIKFEKNKYKSVGSEEWIPMNSARLRQKVSTRNVPVFQLEEKCLARWAGPRKFPGTVKKILENDTYEILFDDNYVKNVRAVHMSKIEPMPDASMSPLTISSSLLATSPLSSPIAANVNKSSPSSSNKKRAQATRKDWPLLDLSKIDLASLNLPEIPHDGEWTCHWVNDQPIGREGFLIVGEHRKPTVIVEDWRLPPGWIKHMYQRSNVLGKWDVILVTPNQKRFRSKSDLKTYLEEQGQVYNPDIYDFSIHRRRAKDISAYVYTAGYTPQTSHKQKPYESPLTSTRPTSALSSPTPTSLTTKFSGNSSYMETPVAPPVPPIELMTTCSPVPTSDNKLSVEHTTESKINKGDTGTLEDGSVYINNLKVMIVNNLFRCPQKDCTKHFRKENHLQIHIKHYHRNLAKFLGQCPKMLDLAEKLTHTIKPDHAEPIPKNQIPNQQFFAKLHEQDLQHQARRKPNTLFPSTALTTTSILSVTTSTLTASSSPTLAPSTTTVNPTTPVATTSLQQTVKKELSDLPLDSYKSLGPSNDSFANISSNIEPKRFKQTFSPLKRSFGSRRSNRQRTTRRYLTASQATAARMSATGSNHSLANDLEDTRHSFNGTPDAKKPKLASAISTPPLSSIDSPMTADSGSIQTPSSNEGADPPRSATDKGNYIKENGEMIKIVRMKQEEIINCLCQFYEEDGLMIQCELCLCWQHGVCYGINKESDVPEKYVCYICLNPQRGRESMRYKHDQDWLYEGLLPTAKYHRVNPQLPKRFETLKTSHTVTGNVLEMARFANSLKVKINIASNRSHPKLYLWANKWDEAAEVGLTNKFKKEIKEEEKTDDNKKTETRKMMEANAAMPKKIKIEEDSSMSQSIPEGPRPEPAIDPVECQYRLMEHITIQQEWALQRLNELEREMDELEQQDELPDLKDADIDTTKDVVATYIKELEVLNQVAKINTMHNERKSSMKNKSPGRKSAVG